MTTDSPRHPKHPKTIRHEVEKPDPLRAYTEKEIDEGTKRFLDDLRKHEGKKP